MARILSVSYDSALLSSRELLLQSLGYEVVSVPRFGEALEVCNRAARFDVFVLGHSIPQAEKEILVAAFRAHSRSPIVALKKYGEDAMPAADFEIEPDPDQLLEVVSRLASSSAASA